MSEVALIVTVEVHPERREEFLSVMEEDAEGSRELEPGCLRFDVLEDQTNPNKFVFYEVYRSQDAIDAHKAMPHYLKWSRFYESGGAFSLSVIKANAVFCKF